MPSPKTVLCDGCGQSAEPDHITRRLKRLENTTRYRPIHVQALILGAASPVADTDYLYSSSDKFSGEGLAVLTALGIYRVDRSVELVLTEFQRQGFLLAHILECPVTPNPAAGIQALLETQFAATAARIRRSLKPKKLVLFGQALDSFAERLANELPGVEMVQPEQGRSFALEKLAPGSLASALKPTAAAPL